MRANVDASGAPPKVEGGVLRKCHLLSSPEDIGSGRDNCLCAFERQAAAERDPPWLMDDTLRNMESRNAWKTLCDHRTRDEVITIRCWCNGHYVRCPASWLEYASWDARSPDLRDDWPDGKGLAYDFGVHKLYCDIPNNESFPSHFSYLLLSIK